MCIVQLFPATNYVEIPSGFFFFLSFLFSVLKKTKNIVVIQGIIQFLPKQEGLQVLTADFTFLKNPSPRHPLYKVGGADGLGGRSFPWRGVNGRMNPCPTPGHWTTQQNRAWGGSPCFRRLHTQHQSPALHLLYFQWTSR